LRRSPVTLAAISKDDVEKAEKDAKLAVWAAQTLASKGAPQAAMMQAKADRAVQTMEALKQQFQAQEDGKPAVPVVAAAISAPSMAAAAPGAISKDDLEKAEKDARLFVWAAQKLASEGAPQAAAMQAKADKALQALEALKQQFQGQEVPASAPAAPVLAAAAPAVAAAAPGGISKDDVQKAEKDARLFVWAAQKLASEGAPQAAAMQAKADRAVQALEALQRQFQGQEAARTPAMPVAAAPLAVAATSMAPAAAVSSAPSAEEVAAAKKAADLQAWALKTLVATGAPEAAAMQAKAAESARKYESLKAAYELVAA